MDDTSVEPVERPDEPRCVQFQATLAGKVNLADFENAMPVAPKLSPLNELDINFKALLLTASSEPAFLKPETWHNDYLGAGRTVRISALGTPHDGALLGQLTEVDKAAVTFGPTTGREPSNELAQAESTFESLPRNQWPERASLPDVVAAFISMTNCCRSMLLSVQLKFSGSQGNWLCSPLSRWRTSSMGACVSGNNRLWVKPSPLARKRQLVARGQQ